MPHVVLRWYHWVLSWRKPERLAVYSRIPAGFVKRYLQMPFHRGEGKAEKLLSIGDSARL